MRSRLVTFSANTLGEVVEVATSLAAVSCEEAVLIWPDGFWIDLSRFSTERAEP